MKTLPLLAFLCIPVPAHGYGRADVEAHQTVFPDSLFRVASLSKPFTAVAVLAGRTG